MPAPERGDLATRLDAVIAAARGKAEAFQTQAETSRQEIRARFEKRHGLNP